MPIQRLTLNAIDSSMLDPTQKELIALEVIRVLYCSSDRSVNKPPTIYKHAPFHASFMSAVSPNKSGSWLNTPQFTNVNPYKLAMILEWSFFEKIAHILSNGDRRRFVASEGTGLKITLSQKKIIDEIIRDLEWGSIQPSREEEDTKLARALPDAAIELIDDFIASIFVETDESVEIVVLKPANFHSWDMQREKADILRTKAALRIKFPSKQLRLYWGFPFDPWCDLPTDANKLSFINKLHEGGRYLAYDEILLAGELWDRLSEDSNTLEQILAIIRLVAVSDFLERYRFLNDPLNVDKDRVVYARLLADWNLDREFRIVENIDDIRRALKEKKIPMRLLNNPIFDSTGNYRSERYLMLKAIGLL